MSVIIRKNLETLTDAEWNRFVAALNQFKARGGYDLITQHHAQAMNTLTLFPGETGTKRNVAHRGPSVLPWHREMLWEMEKSLCAIQFELFPLDPLVGIPYWRWNVNGSAWKTAAIWNRVGGDGSSASGYAVTTGPFANWTSTIVSATSPGGFKSRPGIIRQFRTGSMPSWGNTANVNYDAAPWNENTLTTASFRAFLEQVHNTVHTMIGGDMTAPTSPNDPLFWFHHSNCDRAWARWQAAQGVTKFQPNGEGPAGHNRYDIPTFLDSTAQNKFHNDMLDRFNFNIAEVGSGFDYDTLIP